jgi:putative membrane protein
MTAHQKAWALHKGYATEGTDPALKQVAATAVPIVERHITHLKSLMPASMTAQ